MHMNEKERIDLWRQLAEKGFSMIPGNGKAPIEKDWTKWCHVRRPFNRSDFLGHNALVACGPASGALVLDADDLVLFGRVGTKNGWSLPPTFTVETGSGTDHYYYQYPNDGQVYGNRAFKKLGFDLRGDGGCVVAAGSIHPDTGRAYFITKDVPLAPAPAWILEQYRTGGPGGSGQVDLDTLQISSAMRETIRNGAPKGQRSEAMMKALVSLLGAGVPESDIYRIFDSYPIGEKYREKGSSRDRWLRDEIGRARQYVGQNEKDGRISQEALVTQFIEENPGWASIDDVSRWTGVPAKNAKVYLARAFTKGIMERHPTRAGLYRRVITHAGFVDYKNIDPETEELNVRYPGGYEKYIRTPAGGVFTLGGESGAGKTTYCLNFIRLNDERHKIVYISTEFNRNEVRGALERFAHETDPALYREIDDWKFQLYECIGMTLTQLKERIVPDAINIIDWVQMSADDYPNLGAEITLMKSKVGQGLLVLVMQKDPDRDHTRGRYQGVDATYLTLLISKTGRPDVTTYKVTKARYSRDPRIRIEYKARPVQNLRGCKLRFAEQGFRSSIIATSSSVVDLE